MKLFKVGNKVINLDFVLTWERYETALWAPYEGDQMPGLDVSILGTRGVGITTPEAIAAGFVDIDDLIVKLEQAIEEYIKE